MDGWMDGSTEQPKIYRDHLKRDRSLFQLTPCISLWGAIRLDGTMTNGGGYSRLNCSDRSQTTVDSNNHPRYSMYVSNRSLDGVADKPHGKKSTIHQMMLWVLKLLHPSVERDHKSKYSPGTTTSGKREQIKEILPAHLTKICISTLKCPF